MRQSTLVLTELTPNEAASVFGGRGAINRAIHIHRGNFKGVGSGYGSGGNVENGNSVVIVNGTNYTANGNVVVIVDGTNYTINSGGGDTNDGGTGTVTLTF